MVSKIKNYVNSLRCPMCNCGLDGSISYNNQGNLLYCVSDPDHYLKHIVVYHEQDVAYSTDDKLYFNVNKTRYIINKFYHQDKVLRTIVSMAEIDGNGDIIEGSKTKSITIDDGDLIDFSSFDKEQIVKRIKMLMVFQ